VRALLRLILITVVSAVGIALGVLMTMLAAITLLPAVLGFVGHNIDKLGLPHTKRAEGEVRESFWYRWSRVLQRRPWPPVIAGLLLLLVLAAPVLSMRLAFADAGNRPTSDTTRRAYDLLSKGFGSGFNGPLVLAAEIRGPASRSALEQLRQRLVHTSDVASVTPVQINPAGNAAVITVYPRTAPQAAATRTRRHGSFSLRSMRLCC